MGTHPLNLALRFLLEMSALVIAGMWGWKQSDGWLRFLLAIGIPIALAVVWGVFAVPDDPSRSGSAPIPISGGLRLLLELAFFAVAAWCLKDLKSPRTCILFSLIVLFHYCLSYDRIQWLFR